MVNRFLVGVCLLAACSPPPEMCGMEVCTREQRCTPEKKCVTDGRPALTLDLPVDMQVVTTDVVEVKGTAIDDDVPPSVEASTGPLWTPAKLAADGSFSIMVPMGKVDGSTAVLTARALDSKKQESKSSRTLNVDNVPPDCRFVTPLDGALLNVATGPTQTISLRATDGSLILKNPRFSTDDGMTFKTPGGDPGTHDFNWVLPIENGGAHVLVFRIDDGASHTCEAKITVLVDNVKPTVAFTAPAPGALLGVPFFTAGGKVTGTAGDGARQLKSVTLDFADTGGPRPATLTAMTWSVGVPSPLSDDYKLHMATAVATDLANNTESATLAVTVDVKPPALAITNPADGAKLNIAGLADAGNLAPLRWTMTDGDPVVVLGIVTADGGFLVPPSLATAPTDNGKQYRPVLRATDRAGNVSTASVGFTVDRVNPTVSTYTPMNNTRMWTGIVTADFSEPMMGGAGISLNPQLPGSFTTPTHFEIPGLAKDSVYTGTTGLAEDLHGNPLIPINFRFHTETVVPLGGAVLGTGYDKVLMAAADAEGVLNVVARVTSNGSVDWIQFDSKTGQGFKIDNYGTESVANLVTARVIQADLSSRRLSGLWFDSGGFTNTVRYNINRGAVQTVSGGWAFIPYPAFTGEGVGLGEFGTIVGTAYKRTGRTDLPINLTTINSIAATDSRWELVEHSAGGTKSQSFGCPSGACSLTAVKTLGGAAVGTPNSASSKLCSIHGYLNASTEMTTLFKYQPGCGTMCAADINETNNFDQVTADPAVDGTFYGFNAVALGTFQIKKRVLAVSTCAGAIADVGLPISLGTVTQQPRIVVIRGQVGLVYTDGNYLLKFVTP